jgi:hypothetical protein
MSRFAFRGRARGGRILASMLLAIGGLTACGPDQPDAAGTASAAVAKPGAPPDKAECRRFTTCVPENPCHTGWVTGCSKGVPICTDIGGWLSNGTSCGEDLVCYMGECEPCAAGQSCQITDRWGNPDLWACRAGGITCDTGQPVCKDVGPAPDGTTCGGGGPWVCKSGACTTCFEGSTCPVPDQPCHQGTVQACATTGGTCVDTSLLPNGTSCGYGTTGVLVCNEGECQTCPWYEPCEPEGLPCQYGTISCWTGPQVCAPSSWKPDLTPCDGGACMSGQCVPSCGPGSRCQPPDPCYGSGTISCETGECLASGAPFPDGWSCGAGGETCQAGSCTDDADPRLMVRSAWWYHDLTGTTWSRCAAAGAGLSRRVTESFGVGTSTHVVESFATTDCSGEVQTRTSGGRTVASSGDRYVTWTGGTPPSTALPGSPTATAVHFTGEDPPGTTIDIKQLYLVNDGVYPRQLFRGDGTHLGADGYPTRLLPDPKPFTEVILPTCGPTVSCPSPDACHTSGSLSCSSGLCDPQQPVEDWLTCGVGGESCQGGTCTAAPGADPWVRSSSIAGAVDLAGTTWSDCLGDDPAPGQSRLRIDTWAAGAITHQEVLFTSSVDCTGPTDPMGSFTLTGTITSGGDRRVSWESGAPTGLPAEPTATGIHVSAPDSPIGALDLRLVVFVDESVAPRRLYQGDKTPAYADGYPALLHDSMPLTEVTGP